MIVVIISLSIIVIIHSSSSSSANGSGDSCIVCQIKCCLANILEAEDMSSKEKFYRIL